MVAYAQSVREKANSSPEIMHETTSTSEVNREEFLWAGVAAAFLPLLPRSPLFVALRAETDSPTVIIPSITTNAATDAPSAAKRADAKLTLPATLPIGTNVAR